MCVGSELVRTKNRFCLRPPDMQTVRQTKYRAGRVVSLGRVCWSVVDHLHFQVAVVALVIHLVHLGRVCQREWLAGNFNLPYESFVNRHCPINFKPLYIFFTNILLMREPFLPQQRHDISNHFYWHITMHSFVCESLFQNQYLFQIFCLQIRCVWESLS